MVGRTSGLPRAVAVAVVLALSGLVLGTMPGTSARAADHDVRVNPGTSRLIPPMGVIDVHGAAVLFSGTYAGVRFDLGVLTDDEVVRPVGMTVPDPYLALGDGLVMSHDLGRTSVTWSEFAGDRSGTLSVLGLFRGWTADGWLETRAVGGGSHTLLVERRPLGADRTVWTGGSGTSVVAATGGASGIAWVVVEADAEVPTGTLVATTERDGTAESQDVGPAPANPHETQVLLSDEATWVLSYGHADGGPTARMVTVTSAGVSTGPVPAAARGLVAPLGTSLWSSDGPSFAVKRTDAEGRTTDTGIRRRGPLASDGTQLVVEQDDEVTVVQADGGPPRTLVDLALTVPDRAVGGELSPGQVHVLEEGSLRQGPVYAGTASSRGLSGTATGPPRLVAEGAGGYSVAGWGPWTAHQRRAVDSVVDVVVDVVVDDGDGVVMVRHRTSYASELEMSGRWLRVGGPVSETEYLDVVTGETRAITGAPLPGEPPGQVADISGDQLVRLAHRPFGGIGADGVRVRDLRGHFDRLVDVPGVRGVALLGTALAVVTDDELRVYEPGAATPRLTVPHRLRHGISLFGSDSYVVAQGRLADGAPDPTVVAVSRDGVVSRPVLGLVHDVDDETVVYTRREVDLRRDRGVFVHRLPPVAVPPRLMGEPEAPRVLSTSSGRTWRSVFWFSKPLTSCWLDITSPEGTLSSVPCSAQTGYAEVAWTLPPSGPETAGPYSWRIRGAGADGALVGSDLAEADLRGSFVVTDQPAGSFADVPDTSPFVDDIAWAAVEGVTTGYADGRYRPSAPVSRQAMAAFLYRFAGEPATSPPEQSTFGDVPPTSPFFREVEWMVGEGIASGYADGSFRPSDPVSRQAMAAFLHRLLMRGQWDPVIRHREDAFVDVPFGSQFYVSVDDLAFRRVIGGYADGTFRPTAPVSRQAMAAFLQRADGL